jgi:hypothetical protein
LHFTCINSEKARARRLFDGAALRSVQLLDELTRAIPTGRATIAQYDRQIPRDVQEQLE